MRCFSILVFSLLVWTFVTSIDSFKIRRRLTYRWLNIRKFIILHINFNGLWIKFIQTFFYNILTCVCGIWVCICFFLFFACFFPVVVVVVAVVVASLSSSSSLLNVAYGLCEKFYALNSPINRNGHTIKKTNLIRFNYFSNWFRSVFVAFVFFFSQINTSYLSTNVIAANRDKITIHTQNENKNNQKQNKKCDGRS